MTYPQAIDYLYQLRLFGTKLGLEQTRRLAAQAGNPQDRLRFIHVAGTNGKGSVCAMLESIYRRAGLQVGLFTSPHLVAFGERIQVNRQPIPDAEVARLTRELKSILESFPPDQHPTFFEVVTVMALRYFAERKCDLVIWETGMGGRLDATNIVTPLAGIITNIGLDHEKWLGPTLADISREKAGIIKPCVPLIDGVQDPEARDIIRQTAAAHSSPVFDPRDPARAGPIATILSSIRLPLRGSHQKDNAALAITCAQALSDVIAVKEEDIRQGLELTVWAGRMQLVERSPGRWLLLDGAHNPAGFEALCRTVEEEFPGRKPAILLGALADKDFHFMAAKAAGMARRICLVPVPSMRSASPEELAAACRKAHPSINVSTHNSLLEAWKDVENDPLVLITGSVYLVGEAMQALGISPGRGTNEQSLNEWGASVR